MRFVSTTLGMQRFPFSVESPASPSDVDGAHIMGVTVVAWLTRFPVAHWGPAWAELGSFEIRFRAHLTAGLELVISAEPSEDILELTVAGIDGTVYATATAGRTGSGIPTKRQVGPASTHPARPVDHELRNRVLISRRFTFDAARDQPFTSAIADGPLWSGNGWAHPAWMASAANAVIHENISFTEPGQWLHAGLQWDTHRPVTDGSPITVGGSID